MIKKATHEELRAAFETHLVETQGQVTRLEKAFEMLGRPAKGKKCEGMLGILEEADDMLTEKSDPEVLDAVMIEQAQKVEHYEIASYGTLCTWADTLGHKDICDLLKQTLDEEKATDHKLTELAKNLVNQFAAHAV